MRSRTCGPFAPSSSSALYIGPPKRFADDGARVVAVAPRFGRSSRCSRAPITALAVRSSARSSRGTSDRPETFVTVVIPEADEAHRGPSSCGTGRRSCLKTRAAVRAAAWWSPTSRWCPESVADLGSATRPLEPKRSVVLVPVPAVNDATVRAVIYARVLHPTAIEAIYLLTDPEEATGGDRRMARARDRDPACAGRGAVPRPGCAACSRRSGATPTRGDTVVTVVLPELVATTLVGEPAAQPDRPVTSSGCCCSSRASW